VNHPILWPSSPINPTIREAGQYEKSSDGIRARSKNRIKTIFRKES
jgi:hypothetical protein